MVSIDVTVKDIDMNKREYTSAHIDRYLRGEMSQSEEYGFLLSLKRNKKLRNLAFTKALLAKYIRAHPRRKEY